MAFTYTVADLAGSGAAYRLAATRLLLTDTVNTVDQPAIFADEEITFFLTTASNDVHEAAALGYETWARSMGRVALIMSRDGFTSQRQAMKHLFEAAQKLRDAKLSGTLQVGQITSEETGDYLDLYRPLWRDFDDVPVAE